MNNIFNRSVLQRISNQMTSCNLVCLRRGIVGLIVTLWLVGCGDPATVQVQLSSRTPPRPSLFHLDVSAEVAGSQQDLVYKWFSVGGTCNPQDSPNPVTQFKFADGATRDRVSVEVWRKDKVVGRKSIDVKLDEIQAQLEAAEKVPSDLQIELTTIPPYEPQGGPDTRADIAGRVSGNTTSNYSVVLYARASEIWYIQPTAFAAHAIRPDNTFTSWTHTGSSYAALLVRPGFEPAPRLDVLPKVGGYVVARDIEEGQKK